MIIGLSGMTEDPGGNRGVAGAGKDTVADHLVNKYGFVKVALADPLKRFLMEVYDFSYEQLWGPSPERNKPDKRYPRGHTWSLERRGRAVNFKGYTNIWLCACCGERAEGEDAPSGEGCFLTPRYALQSLGTEWGRSCYNDTWVDYCLRVAKAILEEGRQYYAPYGLHSEHEVIAPIRDYKGVVVPDIRFPNENNGIAMVPFTAGIRMRIKRKVAAVLPGELSRHSSETSLEDMHDDGWDWVVKNDSTERAMLMQVDQLMARASGRIIPYDDAQKDIPPFLRK